MKKIIALLAALLCLSLPASADYRYNGFGEPVATARSFTAVGAVNGTALGIGDFKSPSDVFADENGLVYILDCGNNRVVVLNNDLTLNREVRPEGFDLGEAGGLYAAGGLIYVAHAGDEKIYVINTEGETVREISRPDSPLLEGAAFTPLKVLADGIGTVYMLSANSTQGAYMIGADNSFLGFFGRNDVVLTFRRMMELASRRFASDEQRETMQNFIPVEFANFDVDADGFIYTVTSYSENPEQDEMIKKLNPMGDNVLSKLSARTWGDNPDAGAYPTSFADIAADENGFSYALDGASGKIFWYDDNLSQICAFGGSGNVLGAFTGPTAVETLDSRVLVLDNVKNSVTVFEKTRFGELMTEGRRLYNSGYFKESKDIFREIITMDPDCDFAWGALGAAVYEEGDAALAKEYFERSRTAAEKYSEVKKQLRSTWMKEHFALIFGGVIALALIIIAASKLVAAKLKEGRI